MGQKPSDNQIRIWILQSALHNAPDDGLTQLDEETLRQSVRHTEEMNYITRPSDMPDDRALSQPDRWTITYGGKDALPILIEAEKSREGAVR
jgi:hypothetical protein